MLSTERPTLPTHERSLQPLHEFNSLPLHPPPHCKMLEALLDQTVPIAPTYAPAYSAVARSLGRLASATLTKLLQGAFACRSKPKRFRDRVVSAFSNAE